MAKPLTLTRWQYVFTVAVALTIGVSGGMFEVALQWHIRQAMDTARVVEFAGLFGLLVLLVWRGVRERTSTRT